MVVASVVLDETLNVEALLIWVVELEVETGVEKEVVNCELVSVDHSINS